MKPARFKKMLIFAMLVTTAMVSTLPAQSTATTQIEEPETQGAVASMRLLSESQYTNTIASIFGRHIVPNVRFSPVQRVGDLAAIGARSTVVTIGALEPLENSSRMVANQVVSEANRELLIPCQPAAVDRLWESAD